MQLVGGLEETIGLYTFPFLPTGSPVNLDTIIEIKGEKNNKFKRFFGKVKNSIKENSNIIKNSLWVFVKPPIGYYLREILKAQKNLEMLKEYSGNSNNRIKSGMSRIATYGLIALSIGITVAGVIFGLHSIHSLPSSNHVEYLGSPNGYEAFVPNGQTINYHGHTDPVGDLILNNGNTIHNVVWDGQYANTIIQNHNQIVQLNSQFVGQTDPVNGQPYVPLQDFYVIKGQVPIEQVTINGQTYYVIQASSINPGYLAGFYTYDKWVPNFVVAINTPGTYAAGLPGNSPVFQWTNVTGTVAYQTMVYQHYIPAFDGGYVLVLPNKTIISYGAGTPSGSAIPFDFPQQGYNPSS